MSSGTSTRRRTRAVLGDPRRRGTRRQRRGFGSGCTRSTDPRRPVDPACDARGDRVVRRRGGGRAGRAVDDRQRHGRAANAVPARRGARPARDPGTCLLRRRDRGRRARLAPFRALADPIGDSCDRCPMPRSTACSEEAGAPDPPRRSRAPSSSIRSTAMPRRRWSSISGPRPRQWPSPSCAFWAARWRASRSRRPRSHTASGASWLLLARSTSTPMRGRSTRRVTAFAEALRVRTPGVLRQLPR